jgi:hypothetical protein
LWFSQARVRSAAQRRGSSTNPTGDNPASTPGCHQDGCRQFWSYRLPDPDHRHVLAAAVTEAADVVMTFNLKVIPAAALAPHGMASQHPDAFLRSIIVAGSVQVLAGVHKRLARPTNPPHSASSYVNILRRLGLTGTAAFLDDNQTGR